MDGVSQWETKKMSSNPNKTLVGVRFGWCTYPSWVKEFQIEIGTTTTEYEPYKDPVTYTADENGIVRGIIGNGESMTLLTNTEGVTIEAEYNKDTNKVIESLVQAIISLGGNV